MKLRELKMNRELGHDPGNVREIISLEKAVYNN